MKQLTKLIFLLFVYTLTLHAQSTGNDVSGKVDSLMIYTKKIYQESKNDPLIGKKYGIEVNPFLLLSYDKHHTITAGFSMFKQDQNAELAFPVIYDSDSDTKMKLFTIDAQYRKFLGNTSNGFYLAALAKYTHLNGELGKDFDLFDSNTGKRGTENKFGIGFGIGYRIFSYSGFYWGVNLTVGRYLTGKHDRFKGSLVNDSEFFIDGEILKFGYAF